MAEAVVPKDAVVAQTWAGSSKDIVASVAAWMLVEGVCEGRSWTTLHDGEAPVTAGMEAVAKMAAYRGIVPGTVVVTPQELLKAVQDMAVATGVPSVALPMGVIAAAPEPVVGAMDSAMQAEADRRAAAERARVAALPQAERDRLAQVERDRIAAGGQPLSQAERDRAAADAQRPTGV